MQVKALIEQGISQLDNDEAHLEANTLLQHVLNVNHAWLIAHADNEVSPAQHEQFQSLLQRRLSGEPIAYILGEREFYGLPFKTTPDTLIPRPDTETLVEAALDKILLTSTLSRQERQLFMVLDLGTGSGAIALAIAKHRPNAHVTAVDLSNDALAVAQENAENLSINNVSFIQSNWFDALGNQTFNLIVSNPPYIEDDDPHLSQGDLRFEPHTALASGKDGLDDIRIITLGAKKHLKPGGWLMIEHGYKQASSVANLLNQSEFNHITHVEDLAGIKRVTVASH